MNSDFRKIPIAVIGLGLMGGSFAKRLKELGHPVIGLNRTESVAKEALAMGIVDSIEPKDLKKAEIVIFCTPERGTLSFIKEHLPLIHEKAVLTDIAGVKNGFAGEIKALLPEGMDFVSGHPMCGREGAGLAQADGSIFDGANYVLIPEPWNRKEHLELVKRMAEELGCAHVPVVTAEEHDRAIAYTSDLTHAVATALMNSSSYSEKTKYFIGGSFRDETRVADINGKLWTSLFLANREKLLEEIDRFSEALQQLRGAIAAEKEEEITAFLEEAGRRRREMMDRGNS
ncbi:prephenate dehydrogenase [uncultured Dialister sp.]|uniref:prephenate dehydrogenase n=1 Tax=uncultured Dialister sp. TaxID=278064 RepID=UPI0025E95004|nr:prephenate dehydrogenase [uncultured Dialister sp.]